MTLLKITNLWPPFREGINYGIAIVPPITNATLDFDYARLYTLDVESPITRTLDFSYAPLYPLEF